MTGPAPSSECTTWSAGRIARAVSGGETTAVEVAEAHLERARRRQADVNGFVALDEREALEEARRVDRALGEGRPPGRLAGVPVAIKDNICTRDVPTSCGSALLAGYRPCYDATVVVRLREAGAVLLGKANCDEFGMGSSNENSVHGAVRHPRDSARVAGGSSGGSAALVADGQTTLALGSDTGGSVRQPAAFTGIVGFKPTYGRVSRYGLVAFASSLDQVATLGREVTDAALALEIIAGPDPRDATTARCPVPSLTPPAESDLRGLSIGVPREALEAEGLDPAVSGAMRAALDGLAGDGVDVREVSLPTLPYSIPAYYLAANAEASSNLARYDGVRYGFRRDSGGGLQSMYRATRGAGFGPEVKRRIMLGTFALSAGYYEAYYLRAQRARTRLRREIVALLAEVDLLATPTAPTTAFRLGEKLDDPLAMYLSDIFTVPASLAGLPAISVPCGRIDGLPVGLQLVGPALGEALLARVAAAVERLHARSA